MRHTHAWLYARERYRKWGSSGFWLFYGRNTDTINLSLGMSVGTGTKDQFLRTPDWMVLCAHLVALYSRRLRQKGNNLRKSLGEPCGMRSTFLSRFRVSSTHSKTAATLNECCRLVVANVRKVSLASMHVKFSRSESARMQVSIAGRRRKGAFSDRYCLGPIELGHRIETQRRPSTPWSNAFTML